MPGIQTKNLTKHFGNLVAVKDVTLSVEPGELLCLLGPSGCGKSTTLRMLAGLETPTSGQVLIDGEDATDQQPYQRDTSMVFQEWALFPYKSVLENVAFGPKMKGVDKSKRQEIAREMLEVVHMEEFAESKPTDLSGGQQQRIALARSLAMDPHVLLLDEPLSNLDKRLKEQMQIEIGEIHQQFQKTTIHVTHDQDEAFTLADTIGIMNNGRLVQVGPPREVYNNPKNQFVEQFLGETNFISGTVDEVDVDGVHTTFDLGETVALPVESNGIEPGDSVSVSIRPEVVTVRPKTAQSVRTDGRGDVQTVTGTVKNRLYRGSTVRYYVDVNGTELFVERPVNASTEIEPGDTIDLDWAPADLVCFDGDGERLEGKQ